MDRTDALFDFNDIIRRFGLDLARTRVLRHNRVALMQLRRGLDHFASHISFQVLRTTPFKGAQWACHFVPGPITRGGLQTALFVGATSIANERVWDGVDRPALHHPDHDEPVLPSVGVYDLAWLPETLVWRERILVEWGTSSATLAWSQWPLRRPKPVLSILAEAADRPFPGFANFLENVRDVPVLPQAWQAALASVGGVYLLTCVETGRLYVGSATGEGGFHSRWSEYAADGHGGNTLLKTAGKRDYTVCVLEVASPASTPDEVLRREAFWKRRLGSRAHGLNAG